MAPLRGVILETWARDWSGQWSLHHLGGMTPYCTGSSLTAKQTASLICHLTRAQPWLECKLGLQPSYSHTVLGRMLWIFQGSFQLITARKRGRIDLIVMAHYMFGGENCLWEQMGILPDLFLLNLEKTPRWTKLERYVTLLRWIFMLAPNYFFPGCWESCQSRFSWVYERPALLMFLEDRCISYAQCILFGLYFWHYPQQFLLFF